MKSDLDSKPSLEDVDTLLRSVPLKRLAFHAAVVREEKQSLFNRRLFAGVGALCLTLIFSFGGFLNQKSGPSFISPDQVDAYVSSLTSEWSVGSVYDSAEEDLSVYSQVGE